MKISTRTRYGTRAMVELACHSEGGPLPLHAIGHEQEISVKYLEQLMSILKSGNLVRSVRGAKGGYLLTKAPDKIKLSEIFFCLEGSNNTVDCVQDNPQCDRAPTCPVRPLWQQVNNAIIHTLQSVTLQDLIDKRSPRKTITADKSMP